MSNKFILNRKSITAKIVKNEILLRKVGFIEYAKLFQDRTAISPVVPIQIDIIIAIKICSSWL
jgi:hypothetical protein